MSARLDETVVFWMHSLQMVRTSGIVQLQVQGLFSQFREFP
jgi:hypothetical protein